MPIARDGSVYGTDGNIYGGMPNSQGFGQRLKSFAQGYGSQFQQQPQQQPQQSPPVDNGSVLGNLQTFLPQQQQGQGMGLLRAGLKVGKLFGL